MLRRGPILNNFVCVESSSAFVYGWNHRPRLAPSVKVFNKVAVDGVSAKHSLRLTRTAS